MTEHVKRTAGTILELTETMEAGLFENPCFALIPILGDIAMNLAVIADVLEDNKKGEETDG